MRFFVHREACPWVPTDQDVSVLKGFFGPRLPNGRLWIWPRRLASQILGRPAGPTDFRAFTRGDESHVFVDPSETRPSVSFIIAHELTHQLVDTSPTLSSAFADSSPRRTDRAGDRFHEIDAEERFCDGIANRLLGTRYDRSWWRRRVG